MTRFTERTRHSLREELLDAAAALLAESGFTRLRMADIAESCGVSRQTVYNEFANKEALVSAVALRTESRFLEEIERRIRGNDVLTTGLTDSLSWTIEHARTDRLVASVLHPGNAADLLPYLTGSKSEPLLHSATAIFHTFFTERTSAPPEVIENLAEQLFRLVISHIAMPSSTPEQAAEQIAALVTPHLE